MPDQTTFDRYKLDQLVLFLCDSVDTPANLGAVKLHKTLWNADRIHFARTGRSITGQRYIKMPQGPFGAKVDASIKRLKKAAKLAERSSTSFGDARRQFFATAKPDLSVFTPDEIALASQVMASICYGHTAGSISDLSHDRIWEIAAPREVMPLDTVFAVNLDTPDPRSLADVLAGLTEEDAMWAERELEGGSVY